MVKTNKFLLTEKHGLVKDVHDSWEYSRNQDKEVTLLKQKIAELKIANEKLDKDIFKANFASMIYEKGEKECLSFMIRMVDTYGVLCDALKEEKDHKQQIKIHSDAMKELSLLACKDSHTYAQYLSKIFEQESERILTNAKSYVPVKETFPSLGASVIKENITKFE